MIRQLFRAVFIVLWLALSSWAASPSELLSGGRIDEAIAALKAHVQASPKNPEPYHLLARAYYLIERWDDSIAAAERSVALAPYNPVYHLWLGRAYGLKADKASRVTALLQARKTRAEFERAVELNGKLVEARSDLAEFYMEAPGFLGGGKDKALAQADQLQSIDPGAAHWVRAAIAERDKNYDLAEKELKQGIAQGGRNEGDRWLNLAAFYRRRNRTSDMEQAIAHAVTLDASRARPHVKYEAAELLYRAGRNFGAAAQFLRDYIQVNQSSEEAPLFQAHHLLGTILEKQGDKTAAADEYRAALSLVKNFEQAQAGLRRVSSPLAEIRE
jgi:tetratricopeptide (TPR) repeat protein